jgi:small subunit ribosomal protein S16
MSTAIRLMRFGKKGRPFYRIVILDRRRKRDGAYIEAIGTYDPMSDPPRIEIKKDRYEYWRSVGAQPSAALKKMKLA